MITETQNQQPSVNVYPNAGSGSFGGAGDIFSGMGGGAIFFWLILFFFMFMFMGWGNNGNASGNNGGGYPVPYPMYPAYSMNTGSGYSAAEAVRQGFDQSAVINGISGVNAAVQQGFNNAEISRCNQQANLLAVLQNQSMALQNCCCENRAGIADVKYALATEACSDRAAVKDALYELTSQNNANMNSMAVMFNNGIQSLKDEFCQSRLDAKDAQIAELQRQLTFAQTSDLVNSSRNAIISNNDLQTAAVEQYLAPTARPAYLVQNPNCCQNTGNYGTCCNRCYGQ